MATGKYGGMSVLSVLCFVKSLTLFRPLSAVTPKLQRTFSIHNILKVPITSLSPDRMQSPYFQVRRNSYGEVHPLSSFRRHHNGGDNSTTLSRFHNPTAVSSRHQQSQSMCSRSRSSSPVPREVRIRSNDNAVRLPIYRPNTPPMTNFTPVENIMDIVKNGCAAIMQRYHSGNSEYFYTRLLLIHLYHLGIPALSEVDCFTLADNNTPVLVGRIDVEIQNQVILEMKVAPAISDKHIQQLKKYIRARKEMSMDVCHAAVICFNERDGVEIKEVNCN
jgi:GxxExxY protein